MATQLARRVEIDCPLPGVQITVDRHGNEEGPTLVWLHGEFGPVGSLPFTDDVLESTKVLVLHHPGWGLSTGIECIDRLHELGTLYWWLLDQLGEGNVHLAGDGLGASLAAEIAVQQPGRVSSLTLIAPFGLFREDDPGADLFATTPRDILPALVVDPAGDVARLFFPQPANAREKSLAAIRRVETLGCASRFLCPIPDTGIGARLYRIAKVPVAIIWGETDGLLPVALLDDWKALLPHAEVTLVDNAAHFVAFERPDVVTAVITARLSAVQR